MACGSGCGQDAAVAEHPIIFTPESVRAILDGRKNETRRPVKWPADCDVSTIHRYDGYEGAMHFFARGAAVPGFGMIDWTEEVRSPFGVPGDPLWVREKHALDVPGREFRGGVSYAADHVDPQGDGPANPMMWKSSRFMPKWACRLRLRVEEVWAERLQEIGAEDAVAEGVDPKPHECGCEVCAVTTVFCPATASSIIEEFGRAWDSIYGKRSPWSANGWVFACRFSILDEES